MPLSEYDRIYTAAIRVVDGKEDPPKVPRQRVRRKEPPPINGTQAANQMDQAAPQTSHLPPVSLTPALQTPAPPRRLHPNGDNPPVEIVSTAPAAPTPQPPTLQQPATLDQFPFALRAQAYLRQLAVTLQEVAPLSQSGFPSPGPPLLNPLSMNRSPHPLTQNPHLLRDNSAPNTNPSGMLTTQTNQDMCATPLLLQMLMSTDNTGSDLQNPGTSQTPQDGPSSSTPRRSLNGDVNVGGVIVGNGNELSTGAPAIRAVSRFNPPPMTVTNAPLDLPQSNRSATNAEPAAPPIRKGPAPPSLAASHQFPFPTHPLSTHQRMVQSLQGTTPLTQSGFPLPVPSSQHPLFPNFLQLLASNSDLLQGSSSGTPIPPMAQRTDQSGIVTAQQQTIDRLRRERNEWRDTARKVSTQLKIFQEMRLQGTAQQEAIKEKDFQLSVLSAAVNGNLPAVDLEARLKQATKEVKKKMEEQMKEEVAKLLNMRKDGMESSGEPSTSAAAMADDFEKPEEEEGYMVKKNYEDKTSTRKRHSDGNSIEEKKSKSRKPDDSN